MWQPDKEAIMYGWLASDLPKANSQTKLGRPENVNTLEALSC